MAGGHSLSGGLIASLWRRSRRAWQGRRRNFRRARRAPPPCAAARPSPRQAPRDPRCGPRGWSRSGRAELNGIAADRDRRDAPRRPARSGPAISPSGRSTRRVSERSGRPPVSRGSSPATIASKTAGTPAITCTLPREKPGARDTGLSISVGAVGDARHPQARRVQLDLGVGVVLRQDRAGVLAHVDADAEGRRHRVGGDVVVGRADAARGEDVGVARAERVQRRDDLGLLVGDHPGLAQRDAARRERLRRGAACWCRGCGPRGSRRRWSAWRRWGSASSACPRLGPRSTVRRCVSPVP